MSLPVPASSLTQEQIDRILAVVDRRFDEQIAFLQALVREPSTRGNEFSAHRLVEYELRRRGLETETFLIDPEFAKTHPGFSPINVSYDQAWNAVGYRRSKTGTGRSLTLNAHIDVVPPANAAFWTHPPFSGEIVGDWMYGRGAGDMKAGMAANLFALDAVEMAGFELNGDLHIQSVIEEEVTGNGAAMALALGHKADAILIPEPTDERLVRANVGVIKFAITLRGVPAHPRDINTGTSAIEAAIAMIGHLKRLEARWLEEKSRHPLFRDLANPVAMNIGVFQGGEWNASVSAECRIEGRAGIYPGDDPLARVKEFEDFVAECTKIDPKLSRAEPKVEWVGHVHGGYEQKPGTEAEDVLDWASTVVTGSKPESYVMSAYLDAAIFSLHAGMPAFTYGPISENAHGIDERVSLASLRRVTKVMALFIAGWCGVSERRG